MITPREKYMTDTNLSIRMLKRADEDNLPEDHEMITAAKAFGEAIKGFYAEAQTCDVKTFIGRWARARRVWCDYTGDSLI